MSLMEDYSWDNASKVIDQGVGWVTAMGNAWAGVEEAKRSDRNYYVGAQELARNSFPDGQAPYAPYDPAQTMGVNYVAPELNTGNAGGPVSQAQNQQGQQLTIFKWVGLGVLGALGLAFLVKG